jgi:hypothetical protein
VEVNDIAKEQFITKDTKGDEGHSNGSIHGQTASLLVTVNSGPQRQLFGWGKRVRADQQRTNQ